MSTDTDLSPKTPAELGIDPVLADEAQDFLNPFEKLIPVRVLDRVLYLPENNSLWRGLQYWGLVKREVRIDFSFFCISGTCHKCKALVLEPGKVDREPLLLCQTKSQAGTHIKKLPIGFTLKKAW